MDQNSQTRPTGITIENWPAKQAEGFMFQENIPYPGDASAVEYINSLQQQNGAENVLLGVSGNETGVPDTSFAGADALTGIYVRNPKNGS